jgi:hypothetical protein
MDEEEFLVAALLTRIIKGETTAKEAAEKLGIPEQGQTLHKLCVEYYDYIDPLEFELAEAEDGELSAETETAIEREVQAAAHFAPGHFKIVAD